LGKKKTKTQSTQTVNQSTTVPDTPDIIAARNRLNNVDLVTPIKGVYGRMQNDVENQYFEDDLPDSVKGRIKTGSLFNLKQNENADISRAVSEQEQIKNQGYMSLAGLTAGSNTSGTQSGNSTTTQSDPWGTALGVAKVGIGAASM
jgi:hypothetical protein